MIIRHFSPSARASVQVSKNSADANLLEEIDPSTKAGDSDPPEVPPPEDLRARVKALEAQIERMAELQVGRTWVCSLCCSMPSVCPVASSTALAVSRS